MVVILLCALLAVSAVANAVLGFLLYRGARRLLQYDRVFQFISGDIQTNLLQFYRMSKSPMMSNEPEVQKAHHNMMVMGTRLNEILNQMEEVTGLRFRPEPPPPPPVTVDSM